MSLPELKLSEIREICHTIQCTPTELPEILDSGDWSLCTDSEADDLCKEYIKELVWAFKAEFLANMTDLDIRVFKAIQANDLCEDNNQAIMKLIESTCGFDEFFEEAIKWDGRGHFLSSYDGCEYEISSDLYLYRNN